MKQCQSTGILICHDLSHFALYILRVLFAVVSSAGSFVLRFVAGEAPFLAVKLTGVASGAASKSRKTLTINNNGCFEAFPHQCMWK